MKLMSQFLAAMLLWIFVACNAGNANSAADVGSLSTQAAAKSADYKFVASTLDSVMAPQKNAPPQSPSPAVAPVREDWDKKIIKTGNLTMEVKNYTAFNELLHNGVKQFGGYIAQEEQNQ